VGGVRDHYVEAAEPLDRGRDDEAGAGRISRVGDQGTDAGPYLRGGRLQRAQAAAGDQYPVAQFGAVLRDRPADPAGRAGDGYDPVASSHEAPSGKSSLLQYEDEFIISK